MPGGSSFSVGPKGSYSVFWGGRVPAKIHRWMCTVYGVICVWNAYLSNGRQQMTRIQEQLGLAHIVAMVQWLAGSPGSFVHMGYVSLYLSWIAT